MRRQITLLALALAGGALAWATAGVAADTQTATFTFGGTQSFTATGAEQQYVVPAGVNALHVVAIGGHGGNGQSFGGAAHKVEGDVSVTAGQTLYVEVGGIGKNSNDATNPGQGGFNGGADGAGGGGGASDVRSASRAAGLAPDTRLIVAAGGGGGATGNGSDTPGAGGSAEADGADSSTFVGGGKKGTSSAGGAGGAGGSACDDGVNGSLGTGGAGTICAFGGGGGGGGLYGGGGGEGAETSAGGGGGGGSSKVPSGGSKTVAALSAVPKVEISFTPPDTTVTTTGTGTSTTTTTTPTSTTPTTSTTTPAAVAFGKVVQAADGTLTLTMKVTAAGVLETLASYPKKVAGRAAALKLGKGQLLYARSKKSVRAGTVKVKLKPNAAAKRALKKRKVLAVRIVTKLTPTTGASVKKTKTVNVRYKKKGVVRAAG